MSSKIRQDRPGAEKSKLPSRGLDHQQLEVQTEEKYFLFVNISKHIGIVDMTPSSQRSTRNINGQDLRFRTKIRNTLGYLLADRQDQANTSMVKG